MATNTEAAILSRAIDPENANWPPEIATAILHVVLSESDKHRANDLAAKAGAGSLTDDEWAELESYCRTGRLLEMLKAKARVSLKKSARLP